MSFWPRHPANRPPVITYRGIVINDLPYPSHVRIDTADQQFRVDTKPNGRAEFPSIPVSATEMSLFLTAVGDENVGIHGYQWYGEHLTIPPAAQSDWWARPIPAAYERPLPVGWYQLPKLLVPTFTRRRGVVQPVGKAVRDDDGLFHPLIVTMMWAYQGWTRDQARFKQNIEFLRPYDYDGVRIAGHVRWPGWEVNPEDPTYEASMRELIDYLYDENGLRSEVFLIGDDGPDQDYGMAQATRWARIVSGREHKILSLEMTNEWHINLPTQIEMVKSLRANTSVPLIALTSPGDVDALVAGFQTAGATEFTVHTERGGGPWREVRQGHDLQRYPGVVNSNEPPGVHSSGSSQTDPRILAMLRANAVIAGAAKWCLHIGDMVTGGTDLSRDRRANLWEIDNIDLILKVVRSIDAWLPAGCENWQKTSQSGTRPTGPQPLTSDGIWSDNNTDHGVDRAYGAISGDGRFVEVLNGVLNVARLRAIGNWRCTAVDPLTGTAIGVTVADGQVMELLGDGDARSAYIVNGQAQ